MPLASWRTHKPLIGVIHLQPLPGSPRFAGLLSAVRDAAMVDAEAYTAGGVDGLMVENFGDAPFHPSTVPPITVSAMTAMTAEVMRAVDVPVGINVLRNDGVAALAVAVATGAAFLRVNVLTGARLGDQGILHGMAHTLLRERAQLGSSVAILADVDVKHSAPLAAYDFADEVRDTVERGGADAVIVSGSGTGRPASADRIHEARAAAPGAFVLVGSGVHPEAADILDAGDGFIVGTWCKQDGQVSAPVDSDRVRTLVTAVDGYR